MSYKGKNPLTHLQPLTSIPVRTPRAARIQHDADRLYQPGANPSRQPTQSILPNKRQREKVNGLEVQTRGYKPVTYHDEILLSPRKSKPIKQRNHLS